MKLKVISFWLVVWSALFTFLQVYSKYHFYFIEQSQLFQSTWEYISDKLFLPGGFALVLSEFLVQFFILPYAGAAITTTILVIMGLCIRGIVRKIAPASEMFLLYLLPMVLVLFLHFDFNYFLAGTIALDWVLLIFYLCLCIPDGKFRMVLEIILAPILFGLVGSAAFLFALLISIYEILNKTAKGYWGFVGLALVILCGVCSVYFAALGEYRFAFLPDVYYHTALKPNPVIYSSWISILLVLLVAFRLKSRKKEMGKKQLIAGVILQVVLLALLCWWGIPEYGDQKSIKVKELDYYARTEQWNKIIEASEGPQNNYLNLCYLNLALVKQGILADQMFHFDQKGLQGLLVTWNQTEHISTLLSEVAFAMGNSALAQEMAFEAFATAKGEGNPRMLKRLVQTNLIYGAYPIAEKYIDLLENTACYRKWATNQRRFLYNDTTVEKDPLLGTMRKSLPANNYLLETKTIENDLSNLVEANPSNTAAIQYLGAFYLLEKNMDGLKNMIETYYGTEVLPVLPKSFQEAVITMSETDPDYWKRFHISISVLQRFAEYKKQVLANRNNRKNLQELMRRGYGDTYWFYYMFK